MCNKIIKLLQNPHSMTIELKKINPNLTIYVLSHEFINKYFYRYTNIYLNDKLVTSNIGYTDIKNKKFLDILMNANNSPIGTALFNSSNHINRDSDIIINNVHNKIDHEILTVIKKIGHNPIFYFERKSSFFSICGESVQKLFLIEYITHELVTMLDNIT